MKKKLLCLLILLVLMITPVYAEKIKENDSNFLADNTVLVEKEIGGNLFAAGYDVKVKGAVDGATFAAGQTVTIASNSDYLFAAGQIVNTDKVTTKDAFLAGNSITVSDSTIRDIFASGTNISITNSTIRNARLAGETITVRGEITGDLNIEASKIDIKEGTVINGKLIINESAKIEKAKNVTIDKIEKYKDETVEAETSIGLVILYKIIDYVTSYLALLIIALLLNLLFKKFYPSMKKIQKEENFALKSLGIGFLALICIPAAAIIAMITIIGMPLALVLFVLYFVLIYFSAIPTTYYVGNLLFKNKIKNEYLLIAVSLSLYYLVKWIPIVGGLIAFASLLIGLGTFMLMIKGLIKK